MKLKTIYMSLGLMLLLPSCKSDDPVPIAQEEINMPISFTIRLTTESGTRAGAKSTTTGGSYWDKDGDTNEDFTSDNGTNFDNTINSITPVLYFVTDNLMQTKYPVAVMSEYEWIPKINEETKEPTGEFTVTGVLKSNSWTADMLTDPKYSYRLALFINCGEDDVMNPLSITNPGVATFNHHGKPDDHKDTGSKHFNGIPMYGVSDVKFVKETKNTNGVDETEYKVTNGTGGELNIDILRSMAKVRVKLGDMKEKVELKKLYISRHAMKGYVVPKKWNTCSSVTSIATNGMAMNAIIGSLDGYYNHDCFVDPQPDNDSSIGSIHNPDDDPDYYANSTELLRFYLPDTYNNHHDDVTGSDEIYLELTYTVGDDAKEYTHPLWFRPLSQWPRFTGDKKEYDDKGNIIPPSAGDPWDIIRNHIYEFVINGVEASTGELIINVGVKDWGSKEVEVIEYDTPIPSASK
ncbi:MAG: hypothetical protein K2J87_01730 [Muribaculaceae bacterium]|nr:hypothetical protein [Muribaculaceae bacterium]